MSGCGRSFVTTASRPTTASRISPHDSDTLSLTTASFGSVVVMGKACSAPAMAGRAKGPIGPRAGVTKDPRRDRRSRVGLRTRTGVAPSPVGAVLADQEGCDATADGARRDDRGRGRGPADDTVQGGGAGGGGPWDQCAAGARRERPAGRRGLRERHALRGGGGH